MNQGTIWTVVHPTVGLPLLLGTVTVIALLVHYAVLSKTTWFSAYWNGNASVAVQAPAPVPAPAPAAPAAK
jgi:light-harvesting protein B-800-850 alpha chain